MLAAAMQPAMTNARPMYSSPVRACRDAALLARMASTVMPMGSTMPTPSRSQVNQPIGPPSGPLLTASTATAKATPCRASAAIRIHIIRRSGAGDSLGVTRYQCPSSIAAFTAPSASAPRPSWAANSVGLSVPPAAASAASATMPTRPPRIARPDRGRRSSEASRYATVTPAKIQTSSRRRSAVLSATVPGVSASSERSRIAAKAASSQAMNSRYPRVVPPSSSVMPTTSSEPELSAAQKIQLTKGSASIDIGSTSPGCETAGQADLHPAIVHAHREGLHRLGRRRHHRLATANVKTATVPGADQDLVARVEAGLRQREVLVGAVVLHREDLAGVTHQDDRRAIDLHRNQLPVAQLVGPQDAGVTHAPARVRRRRRADGIGPGLCQVAPPAAPTRAERRRAGAARSCPRCCSAGLPAPAPSP